MAPACTRQHDSCTAHAGTALDDLGIVFQTAVRSVLSQRHFHCHVHGMVVPAYDSCTER